MWELRLKKNSYRVINASSELSEVGVLITT